jgi:photosystem II stability/assembly factor-like uncharacterized protein
MGRTAFIAAFLPLFMAVAAFGQGAAWKKVADLRPEHKINIAGFFDEKRGITGGFKGATYYTEDGGNSWVRATNKSGNRYGLEILEPGIALSCGDGGDNRISLDGGKTWSDMAQHGPNMLEHCKFMSFQDGKTGWMAAPGLLSSTSDSGATWKDLSLPVGLDKIAEIALAPGGQGKTGFLLGVNGFLYSTVDGGVSWSGKAISIGDAKLAYSSDATASPVAALRFTSAEEGLAILYRSEPKAGWVALSTEDAGASWKVEEITDEINPASAVFLSRDGAYATLYYAGRLLVLKRTAGS